MRRACERLFYLIIFFGATLHVKRKFFEKCAECQALRENVMARKTRRRGYFCVPVFCVACHAMKSSTLSSVNCVPRTS